jgi:hypothetical protein
MNVMTSCSLRPASRARKPPMTWMPSCELPAMRMTASLILETFGVPPDKDAVAFVSLMDFKVKNLAVQSGSAAEDKSARRHCLITVSYE